jgi:Protein of unknown function (DUF3293)
MITREQLGWEERWRNTLWEVLREQVWHPLPVFSARPQMVLSAWNPAGRRLPITVNQARDVVLQLELQAMGLTHARARGRHPDGSWSEDGWQLPYEPMLANRLLRRYGQLAAWVTDADGAHYHWTDPH